MKINFFISRKANSTEMAIYKFIKKSEGKIVTNNMVADFTGKDRSNTYRILQRMIKKSMLVKQGVYYGLVE